MSTPFDGLVAVVTGGGSGIGLETALLLRAQGARVAVLDVSVDGLPEHVAGYVCDVGVDDLVEAAIGQVVADFGRIDIVVNNAGIASRGSIEAFAGDEWLRVLNVNVVGMARVVRSSLPHLRASPSPAIVNTSSLTGTVGMPGIPIYATSKAAVSGLTRALASDLLPYGIRVNCVSPAHVDTPWMQRMVDESADPDLEMRRAKARQPTGELVATSEVARAIVYLAHPLNRSITAVDLLIDGGAAGVRMTPAP